MTVTHIGNGVLRGLAADTKPTTYPAGATFLETDTGNQFYWNGTTWTAMGGGSGSNNEPYSYFVYKSGATYYAKNGATGVLDYNNANADNVLTSIISAISPAGTPTTIEFGPGDFNIAATFTAINSGRVGNIKIKGQGAGITNFVLQTSISSAGRGFDIAGAVSGTGKNLTVNCVKSVDQVTVSTTDAANFAVGDYVLLRSNRLWDTSASSSATALQGEIHKIISVNTGTGVIVFDDRTWDSYATADTSNIIKLSMLKNITLEDFTIKPVSAAYTDTHAAYLRFYFIDNLQIRGVEMQDNVGEASSGFRLESIINSKLDILVTQTGLVAYHELPDTGQYGVYLGSACQQVQVNLIAKGRFRHCFTTGGIAGANNAGVQRGIRVSGIASGTSNSPFDTHRDTESITFANCVSIAQHQGINDTTHTYITAGITNRAKNVTITGCNLSGHNSGISVSWEADDVTIVGNTIHDCPSFTDDASYGYGIRINDLFSGKISKGPVIVGNNIFDCGGYAIWGEGGNHDTIIESNRIENCKNIRFVDSNNCMLIGNRIKNGASAALQMTATSTGWTITNNNTTGSAASTLVGTNIVRNNTGIGGEASGLYQANGTGSQTVFNIAHGLSAAPAIAIVTPDSDDAQPPYTVTKDATNIIVTFPFAPPTGTNNVKFFWQGSVY
jgi:parallel beta helix pectate lyase-like protein